MPIMFKVNTEYIPTWEYNNLEPILHCYLYFTRDQEFSLRMSAITGLKILIDRAYDTLINENTNSEGNNRFLKFIGSRILPDIISGIKAAQPDEVKLKSSNDLFDYYIHKFAPVSNKVIISNLEGNFLDLHKLQNKNDPI